MRERFTEQGLDTVSFTPERFGACLRAETAKRGRLAKAVNLKVD